MCKKGCLGIRHLQVVLLCSGLMVAFAMRVNMSMAIVAMTNKDSDGFFAWSMSTQSLILSSFLWGYVVLQIPSGELASKYGGKILFTTSIAINSGVSLLIPILAYYTGWIGLCFCRILQGLTQGCIFPSTHYLVSKWVPMKEKARLISVIYGGTYLGTSMQLMASGFIIDWWGWPTIFYINGAFGTIWFLCYMIFGSDSPQKSKLISQEERFYIQTSLGQVGEQRKLKTPWKKIFTSVPFYALLTTHCGHNWGFWTLVMELPSYMSKVLGVHIKTNGIMTAIPYLVLYSLSFPLGFLADHAIKHNWCSIGICRKICNSIGEFGPAIMLIGLCQVPPGQVNLSAVMLTLVIGLSVGHMSGMLLTHVDIAPNFAGTLMGLTNFFANITGLIAPMVAGLILIDEKDIGQWHTVFYLSAAIYFITNLVFIIFGSNKCQSWNDPD